MKNLKEISIYDLELELTEEQERAAEVSGLKLYEDESGNIWGTDFTEGAPGMFTRDYDVEDYLATVIDTMM